MPKFDKNRLNNKDKKEESPQSNWMQTYSDMVTLLLAFFVLLYTFSAIDVERFEEVMSSIQHSFMGRTGVLEGTPEPGEEEGERIDVSDYSQAREVIMTTEYQETLLEAAEQIEEVYEDLHAFLEDMGLEEDVSLRLEERGIVMELPERVLFEKGEADLLPDFLPTLDLFAEILADIPNNIIVEGHTCTIPINTPEFPSNWELSVIRAVEVARYFTEEAELDPRRFSATGYGEHQPIASNETPEGRQKNRRVSVVISMLGAEGTGPIPPVDVDEVNGVDDIDDIDD